MTLPAVDRMNEHLEVEPPATVAAIAEAMASYLTHHDIGEALHDPNLPPPSSNPHVSMIDFPSSVWSNPHIHNPPAWHVRGAPLPTLPEQIEGNQFANAAKTRCGRSNSTMNFSNWRRTLPLGDVLPKLHDAMPPGFCNVGVLLRWAAGLHEMETLAAASQAGAYPRPLFGST